MKFNKKFNIKKFVKVSAVALAMISAGGIASTVNANTNVHADSIDYTALFNEADKMDAPMDKRVKSWQANQEKVNASANDKAALTDLQVNKQLDPEDIQDPYTVSYLHSKGYTDQQLRDAVKSTEKAMESNDSSSKDNYGSDRIIKHDNAIVNKAKKLHIDPNEALLNPSIVNKVSNETKKYNEQIHHKVATPSKSKSKRTYLSKATVRKIMNSRRIMKRIRADKRAIRNDEKHLSNRNARKFMRNYTKRYKSAKRTKRIQKRAMAVKDAKHYMRYYKDEVKHEKDLVHLIKSTRVSKVTKRHARKSLKRVRKNIRKNRKNAKKAHKHMKRNARAYYRK